MSKAERLIELVKRFPILYDLHHEDYKNSHKKNRIWDEIGKEINETVGTLGTETAIGTSCPFIKHIEGL
ncbi:hypothetical protein R5R35_010522 [Gryllus longicercus]|uniref:MADF domain-containing protein n=1 Tax=Gryllus longicercus TaxID=2509291 RepID=A0AAN9Z3S3_9ORTH